MSLTLVIGLHAAAALAQAAGLNVYVGDVEQSTEFVEVAGRMVGFYNHPSTLGKTVLLAFAFLLPLSTIVKGGYRFIAYIGIALGLLGTALTLSRSNSIAVVLALVIWILFGRGGLRISTRIVIGIVIGIVTYLYVDQLIQRQIERPTDERPELLETGLRQLAENTWLGIGPNYYSAHVGQYDAWAADGFPVHVTWIHMAVEIGLPLAILFFAPLLGQVGSSLQGLRRGGFDGARATTFLAVTPGILLLTGTGWGMIATATLPLWYLTAGFLWPPKNRVVVSSTPGNTAAQNENRLWTAIR